MSPAPLVSVVVPCFNAVRYLDEALASIRQQSVGPLEIIVVDDGSTDGSAELIGRLAPPCVPVMQTHAGIAAARNHGVSKATGRYLAFLDADDVWPSASLSTRLRMLQGDASLDGVFGDIEEFVTPAVGGSAVAATPEPRPPAPARVAGSLLIARAAFSRVGIFDKNLRVGETLDWVARANDMGLRFGHVPCVVVRRRLHGSNTGVRHRDAYGDYLLALHRSIVRRRTPRAGAV